MVRTPVLRFRAGQPQSSLSLGPQAFEIAPVGFSARLQEAAAKANSHRLRNSLFRIQLPIARLCSAIREYYPARSTPEADRGSFCSPPESSFLLSLRNDQGSTRPAGECLLVVLAERESQ